MPRDPEAALVALHLLENLPRIPGTRLIAIGPIANARLVIRALRGLVDDYLDEDDLEAELVAALSRIRKSEASREVRGHVIAFLAPSGGSGSSTLAANVSASLAKGQKAVALIDMKLETGDLASLLDLKPSHTLVDLCRNLERMDRTLLDGVLAQHPSGIHLLGPPQRLDEVAFVSAEGAGRIIDLARSVYPYVVVDLDHSFREEQWAILQRADVIPLVFRLDFPSLRHIMRTLEHLERNGISRQKMQFVVNRYGRAKELPFAKAEEVLGSKITHWIPEDAKSLNRSTNSGEPVVLAFPSAKVSKCLTRLADSIKTICTTANADLTKKPEAANEVLVTKTSARLSFAGS
jgi:pilus assembly protein CpaE